VRPAEQHTDLVARRIREKQYSHLVARGMRPYAPDTRQGWSREALNRSAARELGLQAKSLTRLRGAGTKSRVRMATLAIDRERSAR